MSEPPPAPVNPPRKKQAVPRQKMPEVPVEQRLRGFGEVALGFTPELAGLEASRCLQCKKPSCVPGCPVEIDIPAFIAKIAEGDHLGAAKKLKEAAAGRTTFGWRRRGMPSSRQWSA